MAPPLGLLEHSEFTETDHRSAPGDAFLLYTDGLYGAAQKESERWTPARLRALIERGDSQCAGFARQVELSRGAPGAGRRFADDLAAVAVLRCLRKA